MTMPRPRKPTTAAADGDEPQWIKQIEADGAKALAEFHAISAATPKPQVTVYEKWAPAPPTESVSDEPQETD